MKFNVRLTAYVIWAVFNLSAQANFRVVTEPVADYMQRHAEDLRSIDEKGEHVIMVKLDVDHDGKIDVFLSTESSSLLAEEYANNVRKWDLYKNEGNGSYSVVDQEQSTADSQIYLHQSEFVFDSQNLYVGAINEIGAYGLLGFYHLNKRNGVTLSVYVLRDGFFESKNFPDPTASSPVYHRDSNGNIPDLPDVYRHYLSGMVPRIVTVLPQTFE